MICVFFITGKDPLPDKVDGKDINSVAGVLKLYFRELKESLFPSHIFDDLIACSSQHNFNSQYSSSFFLCAPVYCHLVCSMSLFETCKTLYVYRS